MIEQKIVESSYKVAELERNIRECALKRKDEIKAVLVNRLTVEAGYLHMLLRYCLILKQDTKRVQYMISQANSRNGPLPTFNFPDHEEVDLAASAPDLGSLIVYDYYPPPDLTNEDEEEYSIISNLFAALTTN